MILAIDIGNTTVALGGIKDGRVCFVAHMDTVRTRTAAEYRIEMEKVFAHRRHPEKPIRFEGAVLTSVVPQITGALAECARYYTGKKPVIVSPEIRTGLTMGVPDPHAVGKDRLVDAAYAAANFPLPVITVDLGTATTFNVVDENRVFRGGVICPGLSTGLRALGERCAQLPQVHLGSPKSAIGTNTEKCMLSGSVMGTAVLLDGELTVGYSGSVLSASQIIRAKNDGFYLLTDSTVERFNNVGEFQWSQPLSARPRALVEGRQILVFTGNTVQVLTPPEQAASSGQ